MRNFTIAGEYGAAATAWAGAGQYSRMGVTYGLHAVVGELVAVNALVAGPGFDAQPVLTGVAAKVDSRFTIPACADQPLRL
jgi:hypothetical protein